MRQLFVAGNWKMNTDGQSGSDLAKDLAAAVPQVEPAVEVAVFPPFPYLATIGSVISGSGVCLGSQNAYHETSGAFTGEVSPGMLLDIGCQWVILGHSERRHVMGETSEMVGRKVAAVLDAGLKVILCVGELQSEREADQTEAVLDEQTELGLKSVQPDDMQRVVLAYEPVWAIGTGLTATTDQAESVHVHLRNHLASRYNSAVAEATRILYGGSVKPDNAESLLSQPNVDGVLVGGASLSTELFVPIINAARQVAAAG